MGTKIVEFIGLPGCGKSTISNNLTALLIKDGFKVNNLSYKIGKMGKTKRFLYKSSFVFLYFTQHPFLFFNYFKFVIKARQSSIKNFITTYINLIFVLSLYDNYNKKSKYDFVLFDQGIFQAFWSVKISSQNYNQLQFKLPLQMSDFIFQIKASNNEIINRLKNRPGRQSRIEKQDTKEMNKTLETYKSYFEEILVYYNIVPVIINNKSQNINQSVTTIKNIITQ